ncbi:hypothetical protein C5S29_10045 [ANME-1 cluster archaeon GoMg3.2]|nr:hypothetical protein [ANME-1 cluster archaeon GoMg3.2]
MSVFQSDKLIEGFGFAIFIKTIEKLSVIATIPAKT